ncbi:uncharacterized protein EI97DRAFT_435858 [Westerdykella ornata]|uniref:Ribosomal protein S8 n=1 Tax=Westerdykella ornata TaxID=318751 RepID=A0A6A6JCG1_WESOR|nr:uncharacterized protein EI97DRAFT_435858 [Westerdykella ornata]KAF2273688.1 hypothetical protein EI97DRAFT_435858 [Westerdykella ornata]
MSLVNLAHVCSHLQNASKARLAVTSIPVSKLHVKLMLGLQREGFLSSLTLGGPTPPKPFLLQAQPSPEHLDNMADLLREQPWLAYPVADRKQPRAVRALLQMQTTTNGGADEAAGEPGAESTTTKISASQLPSINTSSPLTRPGDASEVHVPLNPAKRRLWLGLKYYQNEPVLKHMKLVSKPTRRIWLTSEDLGKITRTRESAFVKGLTHPGECMFVTTDRGILEARECVERRIGGMALCRVW